MFDNIGGKLKGLAYTVSALGIIASIICAIALWAANSRYNNTVGTGFIVLIGGCIGSWVGGFFTYGFGELIDQQTAAAYHLSELRKTVNPPAPVQTITASKTNMTKAWKCSECDGINDQGTLFCKHCGHCR